MAELDYLRYIRAESERFAACLTGADPEAKVPTCPDWTGADLFWHLAEVQTFWATIVRDRLDDPSGVGEPPRPDGLGALAELFAGATDALVDALASTPPETPIWTWSEDRTVGFVLRWQAHEALMHRLDAEYLVDDITSVGPPLAADGVDAAIRIVFGGVPPWADFTPDGRTGRVETTDEAGGWQLRFGRFTGTSPNTGKTYDDDAFLVGDGASETTGADFVLRGPAAPLDRWLWNRGDDAALEVTGDRDVFDRMATLVADGVE